jgi:hypothetical protein
LADDRRARSIWLCRVLELLADWVFVVSLLVIVYRVTGSVAAVALFMALRLAPRAVAVGWCESIARRVGTRGVFWLSAPRAPLLASLMLLDSRSDLPWAGAIVVAYGGLTALANEARVSLLSRMVARPRLAGTIALNAAVERITFVSGPLVAALALRAWDVELAFGLSATSLAAASVLLALQARDAALHRPIVPTALRWSAWRSILGQPTLALLAGGMFASAALAICLKVVLVELALDPLGASDATLGLLLALVGAGMLIGPLSIPRLLGHLPVALLVTGSVVAIAVGIAVISLVTRLEIVTIVLFGIGIVSITNDMVTTTVTRRLAPEEKLMAASRLMALAVVSGQMVAALAIAALASVWSVREVMLTISAICALVIGALFVAADGLSFVRRRPLADMG